MATQATRCWLSSPICDTERPTWILSRPLQVPSISRVRKKSNIHVADLQGVHVHAFGADRAGKRIAYWESLREFRVEYFREVGGIIEEYSIHREQ
jgi:hypothetical protein